MRNFASNALVLGILLLLLGSGTSVSAQSSLRQETLLGGQLTVSIPDGYRQLSTSETDEMFAHQSMKPQAVFVTETGKSKLSFTLTDAQVSPEELEDLRASLVGSLDQRPGLEWITNETVALSEKTWFHLIYSLESDHLVEQDEMWGTSHNGYLLFIAMSCPSGKSQVRRQEMKQVMESLKFVP